MSMHTPGPWRWQLNASGRALTLFGRKSLIVMDFVRWGMNRATARFRNEECLMERADAFGAVIVGEEHHASWNQALAHPDARLMEAAPQLLEACQSCLIGLENGKGSVPFMISMLRGAVVAATTEEEDP